MNLDEPFENVNIKELCAKWVKELENSKYENGEIMLAIFSLLLCTSVSMGMSEEHFNVGLDFVKTYFKIMIKQKDK